MKHLSVAGAVVVSALFLAGAVFHDELFPAGDVADGPVGLTAPTAEDPLATPDAPLAEAGNRDATPPARFDQDHSETLPAWMAGPGELAPPAPSPSQRAKSLEDQDRQERNLRMQAALQSLQKLQAQGNAVNPLEVEKVLSEVERAHGSSVLQGMRLDVLRQNLRVAVRLEKAAQELQVLQQRSAKGSANKEQRAELQRKLAEIDAIQRELRTDFYAAQPMAGRP